MELISRTQHSVTLFGRRIIIFRRYRAARFRWEWHNHQGVRYVNISWASPTASCVVGREHLRVHHTLKGGERWNRKAASERSAGWQLHTGSSKGGAV